jgi:hypothetical protein
MSEVETAPAEHAHAEATGKKDRTFTWTHKEDGPDGVQEVTWSVEIPRKFKRFKFARRAAAGDYMGALEIVFGDPEVLAPLEDWDLDSEEFQAIMEALGEAVGGTGNS